MTTRAKCAKVNRGRILPNIQYLLLFILCLLRYKSPVQPVFPCTHPMYDLCNALCSTLTLYFPPYYLLHCLRMLIKIKNKNVFIQLLSFFLKWYIFVVIYFRFYLFWVIIIIIFIIVFYFVLDPFFPVVLISPYKLP